MQIKIINMIRFILSDARRFSAYMGINIRLHGYGNEQLLDDKKDLYRLFLNNDRKKQRKN